MSGDNEEIDEAREEIRKAEKSLNRLMIFVGLCAVFTIAQGVLGWNPWSNADMTTFSRIWQVGVGVLVLWLSITGFRRA